jgi:hypothetical protein
MNVRVAVPLDQSIEDASEEAMLMNEELLDELDEVGPDRRCRVTRYPISILSSPISILSSPSDVARHVIQRTTLVS